MVRQSSGRRAATTWIALLRAINVGGTGKVPMKPLAAALEAQGLNQVRTYVQSGNVVFSSASGNRNALVAQIAGVVQDEFGFTPSLVVRSLTELEAVVERNPFPEAVDAPTTLHAYFLDRKPSSPDLAALEQRRRDSERLELDGITAYLHAPDGIARSKLAAGLEKPLGVSATGRNWRSVTRILALAREIDGVRSAGQ